MTTRLARVLDHRANTCGVIISKVHLAALLPVSAVLENISLESYLEKKENRKAHDTLLVFCN